MRQRVRGIGFRRKLLHIGEAVAVLVGACVVVSDVKSVCPLILVEKPVSVRIENDLDVLSLLYVTVGTSFKF